MKDIVLVLVTALISGLLATIVTLIWQKRNALYNRKMKIFETLMMFRVPSMIHFEESVRALNSIDVVFYNCKSVRIAYKNFLDEAKKTVEMKPNLMDKHLLLLEVMAESLGLKKLHWDDIKNFYYPVGYENLLKDAEMLRRSTIFNNLETAKFVREINSRQEESKENNLDSKS